MYSETLASDIVLINYMHFFCMNNDLFIININLGMFISPRNSLSSHPQLDIDVWECWSEGTRRLLRVHNRSTYHSTTTCSQCQYSKFKQYSHHYTTFSNNSSLNVERTCNFFSCRCRILHKFNWVYINITEKHSVLYQY